MIRARWSLASQALLERGCVPLAMCRNQSWGPSPAAAYGNFAAVIPNMWRSDQSSFPEVRGLRALGTGSSLPALRAWGCHRAGREEERLLLSFGVVERRKDRK